MIVSTPDGRHRSEITDDEKRRDLGMRWASMSERERRAVREIFGELDFVLGEADVGFESLDEIADCSPTLHDIADSHYVDRMASIDEFVLDDYYLGHVGKHFYPTWRQDMHELFNGRYTEAIITGSIGSVETMSTAIAAALEEQSAVTHDISSSVGEAASGATSVSQAISTVQMAAERSNAAAESVFGIAGDVRTKAETLDRQSRAFIDRIRAAKAG